MSVETELKLMGIRPTKEQVERIINTAVRENKARRIAPLHLNPTALKQSLVLCVAFSKALNEMMYAIDEAKDLRFKLKKRF